MKKIEEEIRNVVEVIEQIYSLEVSDMNRKIDNLKRINIGSVVTYVKNEQEKGNFKSKNDIIQYIQSIIQD